MDCKLKSNDWKQRTLFNLSEPERFRSIQRWNLTTRMTYYRLFYKRSLFLQNPSMVPRAQPNNHFRWEMSNPNFLDLMGHEWWSGTLKLDNFLITMIHMILTIRHYIDVSESRFSKLDPNDAKVTTIPVMENVYTSGGIVFFWPSFYKCPNATLLKLSRIRTIHEYN